MKSEHAEIKVGGMICRACEDAVENSLYSLRGVIRVKAHYRRGCAEIEYDPDIVSTEDMEKALDKAGYPSGKNGISGIAMDALCLALVVILSCLLLHLKESPVAELMAGNAAVSLGYVFFMGMLTSTHCIAMCGGIVLSQTTDPDSLKASKASTALSALWYNTGRVLSYTVLGGVFGALGLVLCYTAKTRSIIFVMAGLAVLLMGLRMFGFLPKLWSMPAKQASFCDLPAKTRSRFDGKPFAVGLLTGLMPCAPLYAMWLYAMGTGSFLSGAAAMLCFSAGTLPLLMLFGVLGSFVPAKLYKYMLKAGGVLVCSMGLKMLIKGILLSL